MHDFGIYLLSTLLNTVIPWALGAGVVAAILSFTPLGKAILRHLTERQRDSELLAVALDDLAALRGSVGEVLERLDVTERRLATDRHAALNLPLKPNPLEGGRVSDITPH
jgi:hypothetical protein